jgi:perosamine synthetase
MVSVLIGKEFGITRDALAVKLKERGIDTRPFFIPMHQLPPYQESEEYPVAEDLSQRGLNLPSSTRLTAEDIEYIVQTIRQVSSH